ncbi:MAG: outer membrane protein assembly factor BamD [Salibacteraceae bacterium]|jgi:outer membrane protein assembly factor BamD
MSKKWFAILGILVATSLLPSCSEYNRVLKSTDLEYKFTKANQYYEEGDYYKAYPLIEDLTAIYRGQKRSEKLFYMFAYCDFYQEDFLLASHRFSEFTKTFPTSSYTEECSFMSAFSLYKLSPPDKLDQTNTYDAISSLQLFVDRYPRSFRVDSCNTLIIGLERKIEEKVYKGANQYKMMEYFSSAVLTYENILKDFPDTKYREEIFFNIYDSYYLLSIKSVNQKKVERINQALKAYVNFADRFPNSEYMGEAQDMYAKLEKLKTKFENR